MLTLLIPHTTKLLSVLLRSIRHTRVSVRCPPLSGRRNESAQMVRLVDKARALLLYSWRKCRAKSPPLQQSARAHSEQNNNRVSRLRGTVTLVDGHYILLRSYTIQAQTQPKQSSSSSTDEQELHFAFRPLTIPCLICSCMLLLMCSTQIHSLGFGLNRVWPHFEHACDTSWPCPILCDRGRFLCPGHGFLVAVGFVPRKTAPTTCFVLGCEGCRVAEGDSSICSAVPESGERRHFIP